MLGATSKEINKNNKNNKLIMPIPFDLSTLLLQGDPPCLYINSPFTVRNEIRGHVLFLCLQDHHSSDWEVRPMGTTNKLL